jgi:hypothetical protein
LGTTASVGEDGKPVQHGGLLSDIRQLLLESKGRSDGTLALQGSVDGLMAAVHENLYQGAELRNIFSKSRYWQHEPLTHPNAQTRKPSLD